jgi:hypothetical protein
MYMTSEQVAVELTNLDDRVKVTEKGVANFQKFRIDTTRQIGFVYGATWVGGGLFAIFLAFTSWALDQIVPAAKLVIEDYYRNHPSAQTRQRTVVSQPPVPYDAATKMPQTAAQ